MSGHASQIRFSRLGQARGASPGSLDQRSEEWPLCEGKSGAVIDAIIAVEDAEAREEGMLYAAEAAAVAAAEHDLF